MTKSPPIPHLPLKLTVFLLTASALSATTEWVWHKTADGLHPDGNEQQMVWLMNRARANPRAEGDWLATTGDADVETDIAYFNVNLNKMRTEFAGYAPRPPAAFDRRLYNAAFQHSLFLITSQSQTHNGQPERVDASGFKRASFRGNVFSYALSALHAHASFNIDWDLTGDGMLGGRGHRSVLMALPSEGTLSSNVGIAVVPESIPGIPVGPQVVTVNYCAAQQVVDHSNRFIVGTVWSDANGNNRYDPGEGKGGVTVQPTSGTWHAVTGAAGGYAIPVEEAGAFDIIFSGGGVSPVQRSVVVGADSVLVDVIAGAAGTIALEIRRVPATNEVTLSWSGGNPPYQVEASLNGVRGSWQAFGPPTLGTSMTVPRSGPMQFFRVVGLQ